MGLGRWRGVDLWGAVDHLFVFIGGRQIPSTTMLFPPIQGMGMRFSLFTVFHYGKTTALKVNPSLEMDFEGRLGFLGFLLPRGSRAARKGSTATDFYKPHSLVEWSKLKQRLHRMESLSYLTITSAIRPSKPSS